VGIIASAPEEEVFSPRNPGLSIVIIEGHASKAADFFGSWGLSRQVSLEIGGEIRSFYG